jgi:hypothetical protein
MEYEVLNALIGKLRRPLRGGTMLGTCSIRSGMTAVLACTVLLEACSQSTGDPSGADGGPGPRGAIEGSVLLGPICPVVNDPPDPDCADRPYGTRLVVTTADQSSVIKEFASDSLGRFRVEVAPGEYAIRSAVAANVLPFCASSETISVSPDASTSVTVYCDTGIR